MFITGEYDAIEEHQKFQRLNSGGHSAGDALIAVTKGFQFLWFKAAFMHCI